MDEQGPETEEEEIVTENMPRTGRRSLVAKKAHRETASVPASDYSASAEDSDSRSTKRVTKHRNTQKKNPRSKRKTVRQGEKDNGGESHAVISNHR